MVADRQMLKSLPESAISRHATMNVMMYNDTSNRAHRSAAICFGDFFFIAGGYHTFLVSYGLFCLHNSIFCPNEASPVIPLRMRKFTGEKRPLADQGNRMPFCSLRVTK